MIQSGLSWLLMVCLTISCWLGLAAPLAAQPISFSTPSTLEIAMGSKPLFSFSGKRPANLGIQDGKLPACPNTPNCVSSQAASEDTEHQIAAIAYSSAPTEAMNKLKQLIQGMDRTQVITETQDYLYVEFTSALMGFVDDVEFYLDPTTPGQIQVRSASRLGQSDLGVNRKRIEEIRAKLSNRG
jgi:uncharacterized protein (DUF1499 family)